MANAKPKAAPYKFADGRGMHLLVNPDGSKLWRWRYRRHAAGTENMLALGAYPETSLRLAREKREEARALLADGIDPGEHRKAMKAASEERAASAGHSSWWCATATAHDRRCRTRCSSWRGWSATRAVPVSSPSPPEMLMRPPQALRSLPSPEPA